MLNIMPGCYHLPSVGLDPRLLLTMQNPDGMTGFPRSAVDLSFKLPAKARDRGMKLLDVTYEQPQDSKDPLIIFDKNGRILHQWPDDYIPGPFEIQRISQRLLRRK